MRVGLVNGEFVINPTYDEQRESKLNLMVVGTAEGIVMIEAGAEGSLEEDRVVDAIEFGHGEIKKICAAINELAQKVGKAKRAVEAPVDRPRSVPRAHCAPRLAQALADAVNTEKYPEERQLREDQGAEDRSERAEIPEEDEAGARRPESTSTCCAS